MSVRARKRFGQHFLSDGGVLREIVRACGVRSDDLLFEIGPGQGALTDLMIDLPQRYLAVEIDRDLVPFLQAKHSRLELVSADILQCDLSDLLASPQSPANEENSNEKPWKIVGNLPYNISSPLMVQLLEFVLSSPNSVSDMHFMLQKEMADRVAAQPGTKAWGRLSVVMQLVFDVDHLFDVPPESFTPPPKVWSSVSRFTPRDQGLTPQTLGTLNNVLRSAFSGRRKRLSNSLANFDVDWHTLDLDPGLRADSVSKEAYLALARSLSSE